MASSAGVDIGGTKIAVGAVGKSGEIIGYQRSRTPEADVSQIVLTVAELIAQLSADDTLTSIGVAAAGYVDASRSSVMFAPNLPWRHEPLKERLERLTGLPVIVENDANAAAWAEYDVGAGRGAQSMVMFTVGTGLGSGIVIDGHLLRGAHGMGAESGHLQLFDADVICGCGNTGCLEVFGSGSALVRKARQEMADGGAQHLAGYLQDNPGKSVGPSVTALALDGDRECIRLLDWLGRNIGYGAANVSALIDPEMFVVGGGVAQAGDLLIDPMRESFESSLTGRGFRPIPQIALASLGNDAGLVGAALLAREAVAGR